MTAGSFGVLTALALIHMDAIGIMGVLLLAAVEIGILFIVRKNILLNRKKGTVTELPAPVNLGLNQVIGTPIEDTRRKPDLPDSEPSDNRIDKLNRIHLMNQIKGSLATRRCA
jgi:hypothetical protein